MNKIKVILVDDHELVRMGFRLLLEGTNNLEIIAEFSSGEEVVNEFLNYEFDLIVIDISMPGIGGIEAIKRILLKKPKTKILVLSAHEDDLHANRVLKAGAKGYLTKRSAPSELVKAITKVVSGETFLELEIAKSIALKQVTGEKEPIESLSSKEFEIFLELAKGKSVNSIAETMSLSPRTVGTHLYNIKQKLSASNSAELTLIALRAGLLEN